MPFISLITCFVPFLSLPIILCFLFASKNIKTKQIYSILFSISIGFVLYKMVPRETMDLYRYYDIMNLYSKLSYGDFINNFLFNIEPLINTFFYIFSKFNDHNLIIVFTTFISYLILFYIVFDYQKNIKLSNLKINIILFYFLSVFLIIYNITGIRFCLARLIFLLALYLDFYKNKKGILLILLYILPVFFHQSAFLLLILRLLLLLNKNKFDFKLFIFSVVIFIFPSYMVNIFSMLFGGSSYLIGLLDKATKYVGYGNAFANIYKLQLTLTGFIGIVLLIMKFKKIKTNDRFLNYSILILLISIGFISSETISTRFIGVLCSCSFLLFMDFINSLNSKNTIAFLFMLLPFCLFYLAFQFIQFYADGIFNNLVFDLKYTFIAIVYMVIFLLKYMTSRKKIEGVDV